MNDESEIIETNYDELPFNRTRRPVAPEAFTHPEHGQLTVVSSTGRSKVCVKLDGTQVTLSSKAINKLTRQATPIAPEEFVASVRLYLEGLGDGVVRDATAKDVWSICDEILSAPK